MHNTMIFKCSSFVYKHSNRVLTCRFISSLSSVKRQYLKWRLLNVTNSQSKPTAPPRLIPVRTLYYLENEEEGEYKRFPTPLEVAQETMKEICLSESPSSPEDWDNVKIEIMSRCFTLTEENFDSVLMQVFLDMRKLELAQSFMNYQKERKLKTNFVTLCKYMGLCSQNVSVVGQDVILETYEKILSSVDTSVLDPRIVQFLVQGLCATDKWRKSLDYANQFPKFRLTTEMCDAISCAALRNKDYDLARDVLSNWYRPGAQPAAAVFEEYMKFITDLHREDPVRARHCFTNLADYLRDENIIPKQKVMVYVENYFKRSLYSTAFAKVDRDGVCSACKNKLEPCSLRKPEFDCLRDSFLKHSVMKSDVFINTTDSEFEKFYRFVEKLKPFDIVLDGLNVAYTADAVKKKDKNLAVQLFKVVNHLSKSWNRILVLGRHHMKRWPFPIMQAIQKKCFVFFVSNESQDDPFLIYAALASGPNAILISRDMMRDHISRLPDPKLIHFFKKWQQSHQVYLKMRENPNEFILMGPLKHSITIQGSMKNGWHVPYDNDMKLEPYEELNNWLCVQKRV